MQHSLLRARHLIGDSWSGEADMPIHSPADTRELLGYAPSGSRADATAAIDAAAAALPGWMETPAPKRGALLFKLVRLLEAAADDIARLLAWEEGKIVPEARGEVEKAIRYIEFAAGDARRLQGYTAPSELNGTFAFTFWRPKGVVGLITPWNFPVAIPLWKMAPALVAGNTVVLKPAPETPLVTQRIAELIREAGFPPGVVNIVYGDAEPARAIIEDPRVKAISFTGSTEVGRQVEARCGALHKAVQCELGGKNPVLVLDDADLDLAAAGCAQGAFGSTGQRCTATSRAIVMEGVADAFVERIATLARAVRPGHPLKEGVTMGPSVSARQLRTVLEYQEVGKDEAKLVIGGGRWADLPHGYFPAPTIFDQVSPTHRIAREEIFGPVLSVIRVASVEEAIAVANGVEFGLTGAVYTRDLGRAFEVVQRLDTGITQVNAPTMGGEAHFPFGGCKATAVGPKEMGPDAWRFFSEPKTVYMNHRLAPRTAGFY